MSPAKSETREYRINADERARQRLVIEYTALVDLDTVRRVEWGGSPDQDAHSVAAIRSESRCPCAASAGRAEYQESHGVDLPLWSQRSVCLARAARVEKVRLWSAWSSAPTQPSGRISSSAPRLDSNMTIVRDVVIVRGHHDNGCDVDLEPVTRLQTVIMVQRRTASRGQSAIA